MERSINKSKIAETATGRLLVEGLPLRTDHRRHAIHKRIIQIPKPMVLNNQLGFHQRIAGRQFAFHRNQIQCFAACRRRNSEQQMTRHCRFAGIPNIRLDANPPSLRIGPHEKVLHARRRRNDQFHGIRNSAVVVIAARGRRIRLVPPWCFAQPNSIDWLVRGIQHPHRNAISSPRLDHIGYIKHKRILTALVMTDRYAVHPNVGQIIDLPESQ